MGNLKIHCEECGCDWVVYHRDNWKAPEARRCPTCGAEIEPGTWERQVLRGFGEMEDANLELVKDHEQYKTSLFTVSYIPSKPLPDRSGELEELRNKVEELTEAVEGLPTVAQHIIGIY